MSPHPPSSIPRPLRVVVADDDRNYTELLVTALQSDARVVIVARAADGAEAANVSAALRPDVVVMDVNMPRLDGFEATERIVRLVPDVRVVIVSGAAHDEYVPRARAAGAVVYLPKNAGVREITSAVVGDVPLRLAG